jgi:hypothetical protein
LNHWLKVVNRLEIFFIWLYIVRNLFQDTIVEVRNE